MAELKIGDRAPDFTLPSTIGEKVKLGDYLGKKNVVLVFYVLDWSPVCTDEVCGMRDSIKAFEGLDAQILGISVDSIFSHRAWAEKYGLRFPLLSDFNKEVCQLYGVFHQEVLGLKGVAKRSVFVIDKKGVIRYKWVSEDPRKAPNLEEVRRAVEGLR